MVSATVRMTFEVKVSHVSLRERQCSGRRPLHLSSCPLLTVSVVCDCIFCVIFMSRACMAKQMFHSTSFVARRVFSHPWIARLQSFLFSFSHHGRVAILIVFLYRTQHVPSHKLRWVAFFSCVSWASSKHRPSEAPSAWYRSPFHHNPHK